MIDPSETDAALVALLQGDAPLKVLLPGGIWWDIAPQNETAFGIVSLIPPERAIEVFGGRVGEDTLYLVKAVVRRHGPNDDANVAAAAARIDALLDEGTMALTSGAVVVAMYRDETDGRIHYTEVDDFDRSIRWQHRGGRYRVQVSHDPVGLTPPATQEQRP
jgi:hypothetical protein